MGYNDLKTTKEDNVVAELAVASPEATVAAISTVPLKLVVTLNVPTAFLRNVEDNAALVRKHVEELAVSLYGTVASVDIV